MIDNHIEQVEQEVEIRLFLKYFYNKRSFLFKVLLITIGLSLAYTTVSSYFSPPIYRYTSQSVIDMSIGEEAEFQKSMFIAYLTSQEIFNESAKSIGLVATYASWRSSIIVESISNTNQVIFKISAAETDNLVELNRRMVSNAIFRSSNILTGIAVQILEEAELLNDVQEIRQKANYVTDLFIFVMLGLLSAFTWLTLQTITDKRIKNAKDIERFVNLPVIGTIPHTDKLSITEEINLKNFLRGLLWQKRK